MASKYAMLEKAVEITKEYARSGGSAPLEGILERVYEKLKVLGNDATSEQ